MVVTQQGMTFAMGKYRQERGGISLLRQPPMSCSIGSRLDSTRSGPAVLGCHHEKFTRRD